MKKQFLHNLTLLLCALVAGSISGWAETVTYTVSSTSAVSTSGISPNGSTATYSSTYSTKCQLTSGKSMTLTLSGYEGKIITGITLSMKSNKSAGAGSLSVVAGSTTIASIFPAANFNTSSWYGSWSTSYVDVNVTMSNTEYQIQDDENIVITIVATENSLYCQSFTLTYTEIPATSISLDQTSLSKTVGDENVTLTATVLPSNASNKTVTWTSSDNDVATITNAGVVSFVGAGTATITAKTSNNLTATCNITVTASSRVAPTFTLSSTEMTIYNLSDDQTITLTTNSDGAITFTSSDDTKIDVDNSVDSNIGVLTALEAGDYTVTVQTAATSTYYAAQGTVTVHVVKKATTMSLETTFDDGKDLKTATGGIIEGTVKFNGTALSPQPTVTYSSSNTAIATVDEYGEVTFVKSGTTTLTASYAGNDEYSACEETYELVLVNTTPAIDETITFSSLGYSNSTIMTNSAVNGNLFTVTFAKGTNNSNSPTYYTTGSAIRTYGGNTFTVSSDNTIGKIEITFGNDDGSNTITTDVGSYSNGTWTGGANNVVFTIGGTSGNRRISAIKATFAATIPLNAACTDGEGNYYGTYSNSRAFVVPEGLTVAAVKTGEGNTLTLESYTAGDVVPANTGVLVSSTTDGDHTVVLSAAAGTAKDGNMLKASGDAGIDAATMAADAAAGTKFYRLTMHGGSQLGFWWGAAEGAAFAVAANKAYLAVPSGSSAREGFTLGEDVTTGISLSSLNPSPSRGGEGSIYTISGQRVSKPTKGLYISNGRKVVVK